MEKEVLRWWKGSMAEGAVVGWAWKWMDLDADTREGPRGQGGQWGPPCVLVEKN